MADYLPIVFIAIYLLLKSLEIARPGRRLPQVKGWHLKGAMFFVMSFALSSALPLVWDHWLGEHRLIDATPLGTVGGAIVGLLTLQLFSYAWHRILHSVPFLWRWFHQVHHSAERVDVAGAWYFHPFDVAGFTFVGSFALVLVLGVSGEAALVANIAATLCNMFQHSNLKTPRWLGYIVQRPENHSVHHQRGIHAYNYGDIALWDIVFGTFKNPAEFPAQAGFYDGASARLPAMLLGRDVSSPGEAERNYPLPESAAGG